MESVPFEPKGVLGRGKMFLKQVDNRFDFVLVQTRQLIETFGNFAFALVAFAVSGFGLVVSGLRVNFFV